MRNWQKSGSDYFLRDITSQQATLPNEVFNLAYNPKLGFYLSYVSDKFQFNHKIYSKDQDFIDQCVKSYQNIPGNLGVLLSGIKGTGKSVTAKLLCNQLDMPVVIITDEFDGLANFLAEINQDIVVLVDEYEKIFEKSSQLLSIMDGVSMSTYRRVFVLSTNSHFINENLLNRPSRIRYNKAYGNLSLVGIHEIIDDLLEKKEYQEDLIDVLKTLSIVTIDLVVSIITEINIHDRPASTFIQDFNAEVTSDRWDIINKDTDERIFSNVQIIYPFHKSPTKYVNRLISVKAEDGALDSIPGRFISVKDGVYTFNIEEDDEGDDAKPTKVVQLNIILKKPLLPIFY